MDKYRYSIDLRYNRKDEGISEQIDSFRIRSIIIDRDYINNNLPIIYMNLNVRKNLLDDIIKNTTKNTMVLTIYKFLENDKMQTKIRYIHSEMVYFIDNNLNYKDSLDYSDSENIDKEEISRNITIGLMGLQSINNNKKMINVVLQNTTMMNTIHYCTSHMNMIIEKFHYNDSMEELLITPQSTVSKCIKYLNSIKVFYKTPYIFFIDFDCGYLLSTSGTSVPRKGESINDVLIIIKDPLDAEAILPGMSTNYDTSNYQIEVSAIDTIMKQNRITEKLYTSVASISENGLSDSQDLNINQSDFSINKTEIVRTPKSNPNLIENIRASANQSSSHISLNKIDVDLSIFTPNKRYIIRNFNGYDDRDGDFILTRKRDLIYNGNDDIFIGNVMLEFDQIGQ